MRNTASKAKLMPTGGRRAKPSSASKPDRGADAEHAMLARLRAAAAMPNDRVDLTDPDAPLVADWRGAVQGKFYKPVKRLKSFRIDADVLAYFEAQGKGYQATVNRVLRDAMQRALQSSKPPAKQRPKKHV